MAVSMVVSLVGALFIILVFVITYCLNMHKITPHGTTAVEALIS